MKGSLRTNRSEISFERESNGWGGWGEGRAREAKGERGSARRRGGEGSENERRAKLTKWGGNVLYIKVRARGRRVEVSRGGTSERFAPKTFHGTGSSRGQSIFRDAETSRGRKGSKICATLHEKRKTPEKYKKEPRARRAISPFIPIRFSRVHTFPPNPTQLGFKV